MKITVTLSEALDRVWSWTDFCSELGISEWSVNEGYGHTTVELTEDQAKHYGLLKEESL